MEQFTSRGGRLAATLFLAAALSIPVTVSAGDDAMVSLAPGDEAPAFSLVGSDGKTYNLADLKGEKPVVLAWFPKAFTSG